MIRAKKTILAALAAVFFTGNLYSQERMMTLDELLAQADSGSVALRVARSGVEAAREAAVGADRATLLPDLSLSATVGYLGDGYGWGRDSSYSFPVPMPHFSTRFGLAAQQVIYAGGAMQSDLRQAELGVRMEELGYEQRRQDVRLHLVGYFLDLYRAQRQLEVYDSNLALTQRVIADLRAKHEQGTALKNDLTRYELQLATLQTQRTSVENNLRITNSRMVTLAGLPQGTRIVPAVDDELNGDAVSADALPLAVQMAETKSNMAEVQMEKSRAALLPYVALVAQDQLEGPVTIDITPYDINYNYWFVGIALKYDISSLWKNSREVRAARLRHEQARLERQDAEEQMAQTLSAARIHLDEAVSNHAVKQQSLQLATENYNLVADRYENDLALLVDMLDASNQKLSAELDLIAARLTVVYNQYLIQYLNGKL